MKQAELEAIMSRATLELRAEPCVSFEDIYSATQMCVPACGCGETPVAGILVFSSFVVRFRTAWGILLHRDGLGK